MVKPPRKSGSHPSERRYGVRDVGALLPQIGGAAFRRFGFVQSTLLARWKDIVGPVYAKWSVPEALRFPKGQKLGGTLHIRVEGPFAVHLQHVAPQIVDRANQILGHGAVGRLKFMAGEVPRLAQPDVKPIAPSLTPLPVNLSGVRDEGLRAALEEMAALLPAVLDKQSRR